MIDPLTTETLLDPMPDLRRLARRLVRDDHGADDLVQSAVVVALEQPPRSHSTLRAWLARVVTNLARQDARGRARRERREAAASAPEAIASTDALVERLDIRMQLMQAVRSLDEPYREAILLRYFEDLAPRHIAARLGIPVKTVDSRIQRGLERLRVRLDAAHRGDRRAWLVALAPIARAPELVATSTSVGVLIVKGLLSTLAVVAVLATTYFFARPSSPEPTQLDSASAPLAVAPAPVAEATLEAPTRTLATGSEPATLATPATAPPRIAGTVLDVDGKPVGGIGLRASAAKSAGAAIDITADADGRFHVDLTETAQDVTSADARYAAVLDATIPNLSGIDTPTAIRRGCVVIVARTTSIDGMATDRNGVPIEGARVELRAPSSLRARFPLDLSSNTERARAVTTAADGRFAFADAPAIAGMACSASRVGYTSAEVAFDTYPQANVVLVLERPDDNLALEGIVFGRDGAPLAGAHLALGNMPEMTEDDGRFAFEYPADAAPASIIAVARGLLPVTVEKPESGWPPFLEIHLRDDPLALAGTVFGPDGTPAAGAEVWIEDPTVFGSWNGGFHVAENVISNDPQLQRLATADAHGNFRLAGLVDRDYRLRALLPQYAWQIDAGVHHAGDEHVEIRFPDDGLHRRVTGRVIDTAGAPVPGASVAVIAMVKAAEDPVSHQQFFNMRGGSSTNTDERGEFEIADVPVGATLEVQGGDLVFEPSWPVPATIDGPITLRVARSCAFRVELAAAPAKAAAFKLVDADGQGMLITRHSPGQIENIDSAPLVDGGSEVLMSIDRARELVILDAHAVEVGRVTITLVPGQTTVIH